MGDFKINEKTVFTQSGSAEPAMGSTITGIPAAGLTGTLPSGINLASATFPTGHVIQQFSMLGTGSTSITSSTSVYEATSLTKVFSHGSGNKVLLIANLKMQTNDYGYKIDLHGATGSPLFEQHFPHDLTFQRNTTCVYMDSPSGTSTTYTVKFISHTNGTVNLVNTESTFTLLEIQG